VDLSQKWGDYTRVFSLMSAFSKLGHKVTILIIRPEHKKPNVLSFKENSLDVIELHPSPMLKIKGRRGIGKYINYLFCLPVITKVVSKLIKENHVDYVYSYMPGIGSSLPAMRIKSKHKIRHVLDFADLHVYVRPKMIVERSFKDADKILAITDYLKEDLLRKGIDSNKIYIIPNGVDLELFNPAKYEYNEIQRLRSSFNADKIIVFSGALHDLNIIINSAQKVIDNIKNVKYVIIGDHRDPARSKSVWENRIKEKGFANNFTFLGRKSREEIPPYLICADVCVDSFPNEPYYAAAHPIKILEYGACGKPVVATKVSETEKIIKHGFYGFLANPNDPLEFANHLITLLNSRQLSEKMGMAFSDYIRNNFSWNKIALDLQKALLD